MRKKMTYIGTSVYEIITQDLEAIKTFLKKLHDAGGNATEMFFIFTWWGGEQFQPYPIVGQKEEDGIISPLCDLSQWNLLAWAKWKQIFKSCAENKITPFIRIHDFCSLKDRIGKRKYCFINNVQREKGELHGGVWEAPVRKYYSRVNQVLINKLKDAGVKEYFIIPMNEADVVDGSWSEEEKNRVNIDFHSWYLKDLTSRGVPKSHIIMNPSRNIKEIEALGCRLEYHGVNSPETLKLGLAKFSKGFPNGDGRDSFAKGRADYQNWKEPSVSQAKAMGKLLKGTFGYCYFNRATESNKKCDIARAKFDVVKALAKEV